MASDNRSDWPVEKLAADRYQVDDALVLCAGKVYTIDKPIVIGPKAIVRAEIGEDAKQAVLRCTPSFYLNSLGYSPYLRGAMMINFSAGEDR